MLKKLLQQDEQIFIEFLKKDILNDYTAAEKLKIWTSVQAHNKAALKSQRIGLYNENFQIAHKTFSETVRDSVQGMAVDFNISFGTAKIKTDIYEKLYIFEINSEKSFQVYPKNYGSHFIIDFAEKAHNLALKFCGENNFFINDHFNSWPKFQILVSEPHEGQLKYYLGLQ